MVKVKGFTLLELLVVVAIVAILTAISYPMYAKHTIRAACDSGKSGLSQADALMNQIYMKYGVYNKNTDGEIVGNQLVDLKFIPIDGSSNNSNADFDVTVEVAAKTYTITATPTGTGRLKSYPGTLTINQAGQRGGTLGGVDVWTNGCKAL